jgi:hypothetical protein
MKGQQPAFERPLVLGGLLIVGILIALWPWNQMRKEGAELLASSSQYSIVRFELAFTKAKAMEIISSWNDAQKLAARRSILFDFIFIVGYVLIFFSVTSLLSALNKVKLRKFGQRAAILPLIAGAFDVTENMFLLLILAAADFMPGVFPVIAGICASLKFALLGFTVLVWIFLIGAKMTAYFTRSGHRPNPA